MAGFVLAGRLAGELFEGTVKIRLCVKSNLVHDVDDRESFNARFLKLLLRRFDPVLVHKLREILLQQFVDPLRYIPLTNVFEAGMMRSSKDANGGILCDRRCASTHNSCVGTGGNSLSGDVSVSWARLRTWS